MTDEKTQYEQRERELRGRLDLECEKLNDLQLKLDQLKCVSINTVRLLYIKLLFNDERSPYFRIVIYAMTI